MPTFRDPTADSREAYEAIRGLAHATIFIEQPHEAYGVILELLGGVRSLQQVFDQLAAMHERHQGRLSTTPATSSPGWSMPSPPPIGSMRPLR